MALLPVSVHPLLQQLPAKTGILWGKNHLGAPVFLLCDITLASIHLTDFPLKIHTYDPEGVLIEFPFQDKKKTSFSFFLNPSDADQWHLMSTLIHTSSIEIWECDRHTFHCRARKLTPWPERFRQVLQGIQSRSFPTTNWPAILTRWDSHIPPAQAQKKHSMMDPENKTKKRSAVRYNQNMDTKTKRQHTANFKSQVVQELLKEEKTIAQIAAEYEVHPSQLRRWKTIVVEGMSSLFEEKDSLATLRTEHEERLNELYGDIGRLTTQLTWLKKKSGIEPEPR